jgi:hypothetical protein
VEAAAPAVARKNKSGSMASGLRNRGLVMLGTVLLFLKFGITADLRADDNQCDPRQWRFERTSFPAIVKDYRDSIILVNCGGELPKIQNIGTGFLIDSRAGLFITAYHVIKKEAAYDCTRPDSRIVAYPMGDMCKETELKYVNGSPDLDVALLQVGANASSTGAGSNEEKTTQRLRGFFADKPHFELLTRPTAGNETELALIGFSQFVAILDRRVNGPRGIGQLPGPAGAHECRGVPQPYWTQPLIIRGQTIGDTDPTYLRESNVREGDSGGPIFLEDGRVAGIVSEIGFGERSPGTTVRSASEIMTWLISVLESDDALHDEASTLEAWSRDKNIYEALDPSSCLRSNSCIPTFRIIAELQRISEQAVDLETLTKDQLGRLLCPLSVVAQVRDIPRELVAGLTDKLQELAVNVPVARGNVNVVRAKALLTDPKYTIPTKVAALRTAEASLARQLDKLGKQYPQTLDRALCTSELTTSEIVSLGTALENYLSSFRSGESVRAASNIGKCTEKVTAAQLRQVRDLTGMIADVKFTEASLLRNEPGNADVLFRARALIELAIFLSNKIKSVQSIRIQKPSWSCLAQSDPLFSGFFNPTGKVAAAPGEQRCSFPGEAGGVDTLKGVPRPG